MYEDRTQNYDRAIDEEYLIHNAPISLPHLFIAMCRLPYSVAINTTD